MDKTCSVLPRTLPLQWYEAVALVCAVADAVEDRRLHVIPQIGDLALASDGSVHLAGLSAFAGESRPPTGAAAVVELQRLLADLLDSAAPPELKRLGAEQGSMASIADFRRALGFFERPSKEKDLRALAARVSEADDKAQLQAELERLTREARDVEHAPKEPGAPAKRTAGLRKVLIAAGALGAGAAALGTVLFLLMHGAVGSAPAVSSGVHAQNQGGFLQGLKDRLRSTLSTEPTEAKPAPAAPLTAARNERRTTRHRIDRARARTLDVPETISEPASLIEAAVPVLPAFQTWRPDVPPPALRESRTVYDGRTLDVIAAMLVRPQLPGVDIPGLASSQLGKVMVVVDENGRVEQVRLLTTTPARRYYDAMILAAIKAWTFKPATRAGQAVRYRLVLSLT